eukprot:6172428-Pleurochrysis_carterae.AAC.9
MPNCRDRRAYSTPAHLNSFSRLPRLAHMHIQAQTSCSHGHAHEYAKVHTGLLRIACMSRRLRTAAARTKATRSVHMRLSKLSANSQISFAQLRCCPDAIRSQLSDMATPPTERMHRSAD